MVSSHIVACRKLVACLKVVPCKSALTILRDTQVYYSSERTVQTKYLAQVCLCRLEHSASPIIDALAHNSQFIHFYIVTVLCMFCLGCSNKHGNGDEVLLSSHSYPHRLDFRRPTPSTFTPWS